MSALLKATLMALGAGCVLLFAGGFPQLGAPALYHGGAMLLLGLLLAGLSLWGALRLAKGNVARLCFGLFCSFMAVIGLVALLRYGGKALDYAAQGGVMWFGFIGMSCIGLVGVIFTSVFGFFAKKLMLPRLWLAGAHVAITALLVGAYLDYGFERRVLERLRADGREELLHSSAVDDNELLPFNLRADEFAIDYYEGNETYSLMKYDHDAARWQRLGAVEREGDKLCFGEESWDAAKLRQAPGMTRPFLQAGGLRIVIQDAPVVKEYRARCLVKTMHRGRVESREEWLKVNEPIEARGWQITLMSHEEAPDGTPVLVLQLRRAPGRFWTLSGMVGLMLCTACWCWGAGVKKARKEAAHA